MQGSKKTNWWLFLCSMNDKEKTIADSKAPISCG